MEWLISIQVIVSACVLLLMVRMTIRGNKFRKQLIRSREHLFIAVDAMKEGDEEKYHLHMAASKEALERAEVLAKL